MTRRILEIHSLAEFDYHLAQASQLSDWFVQSVDLTERSEVLRRVDPRGAIFMGCPLTPDTETSLRDRGALLFPQLPDLPFDPYRPTLYDAKELYGAATYPESPDAAIYAWSLAERQQRSLDWTLAAALHDHSITDALDEATADVDRARVIGVMGGHALTRTDPEYRDAVLLGQQLTAAGKMILTGGGPGAMEAANLGAYLSHHPEAIDEALKIISVVPSFAESIEDWAQVAFSVREKWPHNGEGHSIGIPTWFYGHEPTNVFATELAKYFTNALREDTLLNRCGGGIVYLPGAAGTVQEIFQAVTDNYYAADPSSISPMILVGRTYWTERFPAWQLLSALGKGRSMESAIHCVDTVTEAAELLTR